MRESLIKDLGENVSKQKKIAGEITSLSENLKKVKDDSERKMILNSIDDLKKSLEKTSKKSIKTTKKISFYKPLTPYQTSSKPLIKKSIQPQALPQTQIKKPVEKKLKDKFKLTALEKRTIKRLGEKEKKVEVRRERKANKFVKFGNSIFHNLSKSLLEKGKFKKIKRELIKGNLNFIPENYISLIFLVTALSFIVAIFITLFFLFFNLIASSPFIIRTETSLGIRLLKVFWILFLIPIVIFIFSYLYPSMEKKSLERKINHELPFATIHMSSISGSMVEPSKIFNIIVGTKEYPNISKEFIKLLNEINVYGYDLVTALRNRGFNSPSKKLAELFNGLATTITSGGNLPNFFEKRSQTLLFDYRIEKEKESKAAEMFMDIYISVVIAAPMILMLLLIMMRISGLGISVSTGMITLIMVLGVSLINILFLTFLHLKQPEKT